MSFEYLNEAFKALNLLQEQEFDLTSDGVKKLDSFLDQDNETDITRVIDPEAETTDELKTSYIGKIIINCNVCHSYIFKDKEDIEIDEDGIVNSEESCPYCGSTAGFTIVGKICPFDDVVEDETNDPDPDKEEKPQLDTTTEDQGVVTEDVNSVTVNAEDTIVTVDTHDDSVNVCIKDCEDSDENESDETEDQQHETVEPLTTEEQEEILDSDMSNESEEDVDYDMDELSDDETNEVVENYLKEVYENVDSFKLTDASIGEDKMLVEGTITFKSGKTTHTGFVFTPDRQTGNKVRLYGLNEHFSKSPRAFSLVGCVEGKKFIPESLSYRYETNQNGKKQTIRGRVCRK